jgi:hypothetical protein
VRAAPVRALLLLTAATGLVVGAAQVQAPVSLSPAPAAGQGAPGESAGGAGVGPVRSAVLACPGPEQQGLPDPSVPEQPQSVAVTALTAPEDALPQDVTSTAGTPADGDAQAGPPGEPAGVLHLAPTARTAPVSTSTRAERVDVDLAGPEGAVVRATGTLAPGLAAAQWHLSSEEQRRGLSGTPCTAPAEDSWLVAGGQQVGRLERLVLVNPGADAVTATMEVYGGAGRADLVGGEAVVVPGDGRVVVLLDAVAPEQADPVVRVTSTGGPLSAFLGDRWLEGSTDRGLALTTPTTEPALEHLVPGVTVAEGGSTALRVAVPGTEQAVVQVRGLTESGAVRLQQDVTLVPAGRTQDIQVGGLPDGVQALQVSSDVPVVVAAGATTAPGLEDVTDLAWSPAAEPLTGLAGLPLPELPDRPRAVLQLVATETGSAEVTVLAPDGSVTVRQLTVERPGTVLTDLGEATAVWVRPVTGELAAVVVLGGTDEAGDLLTVLPLRGLPLLRSVTAVTPALP